MKRSTHEQGRWLDPGVEQCTWCLVWFHYEVYRHCADCDAPVCPLCTVSVLEERSLHCPDCAPERLRGSR